MPQLPLLQSAGPANAAAEVMITLMKTTYVINSGT